MVMAVGAGMAKSSDAGSEGSIESSLVRYLYCVRLLSPEPWKGIRKLLHRFTVTSTTFLMLLDLAAQDAGSADSGITNLRMGCL